MDAQDVIMVEDDDFLSEDSSFYGDENTKLQLESEAAEFDPSAYWVDHHKNLQALAAFNGRTQRTNAEKAVTQSKKRKTDHEVDAPVLIHIDDEEVPHKKKTRTAESHTSRAEVPRKERDEGQSDVRITQQPYNSHEGIESWKQLGESVDGFLARLPPSTTTIEHIGAWIWVENVYQNRRDPVPDVARFQRAGKDLLLAYDEKKARLEAEGLHKVTVTKKLYPDRLHLEEELKDVAKTYNVTCGKWMLFPTPEDVDHVWHAVVKATSTGQLGCTAKVATDDGSGTASRLICVYTKDFSDTEDVKRVLMKLDELGLAKKGEQQGIYYKCDAYTYMDINSGNEYKLRASMYSSKDVFSGKV